MFYSEDKNQLNKISEAVRTNYNERHDEVRIAIYISTKMITGTEVLKLFSCSTQLSMKCHLFITATGLHRLEKYLNLDGFLEKVLEINICLESTGNLLKALKSP